jgi:hypothetical protein
MATCTLAQRIGLDLAILVADKTLIDATNQRDTTAVAVLSDRAERISQLAAAKIIGRLGSIGTFDDADGEAATSEYGQEALAIAVEYAECLLFAFNSTKNEANRQRISELVGPNDSDLALLHLKMLQEASGPQEDLSYKRDRRV